jgi:hypothetical protein
VAIERLKAKRDEIGLTALAKMLGVDAANLGKVIEGKRQPSEALLGARLPRATRANFSPGTRSHGRQGRLSQDQKVSAFMLVAFRS